jgi:hypothetical protein
MTAKEWGEWLRGVGLTPLMLRIHNLIVDLGIMERLAIGGEGETHFYYKDAWEERNKLLDKVNGYTRTIDDLMQEIHERQMKGEPDVYSVFDEIELEKNFALLPASVEAGGDSVAIAQAAWTELAIAMIDELRMDYPPGVLAETEGVKAIKALRRRAEKAEPRGLREALVWYALPGTYGIKTSEWPDARNMPAYADGGRRAREALSLLPASVEAEGEQGGDILPGESEQDWLDRAAPAGDALTQEKWDILAKRQNVLLDELDALREALEWARAEIVKHNSSYHYETESLEIIDAILTRHPASGVNQ